MWLSFLLIKSLLLIAHGTKATLRLAINASPEPFSNWAASVSEDVAAFGGVWLAFHHPVWMIILVLAFMAFAAWFLPRLFRLAKRGFQALRTRFRGEPSRHLPNPPSPTSMSLH